MLGTLVVDGADSVVVLLASWGLQPHIISGYHLQFRVCSSVFLGSPIAVIVILCSVYLPVL